MKIIVLNEVDSTQNIARKLCEKESGDFIVVAKRQIAGYGRKGNVWISPEGGLWFTMVIRNVKTNLSTLPMIIAISTAKTIEKHAKINIKLKWPNDLYIGSKKVGGILCETILSGEEVKAILVGIGLNVNINEIPEEIKGKATSIKIETGKEHNLMELLKVIVEEVYEDMKKPINEIMEEWIRRDILVGRNVELKVNGGRMKAYVSKINEDGSITIKHDSLEAKIYYWQIDGIEILN
jgi:BirA family biotin operon repressor/biotin-[acetyl-CoA-carboxylase] ligase